MSQDTIAGRFHTRLLRRRKRHDYFLVENEFRYAAECERMRVDRNGSVLSLLLIQPHSSGKKEIRFFSRVLEGRLRATDTPGLLQDGRIGILLPDTPAEGAWKVAEDISEIFPPGPTRPQCEVLVYPDQKFHEELQSSDQAPIGGSSLGNHGASQQHSVSEFFFASPVPRWKRAIDIIGSLVGMTVAAPILAIAAIVIKLTSPGPVFFKQEREGYAGRRFTIYKLRTMCAEAETMKENLRRYNELDGPAFKMQRDPRRTFVGRFLRWSSIDEIPQFINVLRGEMSLVGPRPLPTEESLACEGWQRRRLCVMPGMTCTWQVSGRGKVQFNEWVRMDLQYVEKSGVVEDLRLILITVPSVLIQKGMR